MLNGLKNARTEGTWPARNANSAPEHLVLIAAKAKSADPTAAARLLGPAPPKPKD